MLVAEHACRTSLLAGLVLFLAACATTTPPSKTAAPASPSADAADSQHEQSRQIKVDASVPAKYLDAVREAQAFGKLLYRQDTASWVSTDAIVARGLNEKYAQHAAGWISEGQDLDGHIWDVAYIQNIDGKFTAFADVGVDLSHSKPRVEVQENIPARALSDYEIARVLLRNKTIKMPWLRCTSRYNYVTSIRMQDGQKWIVVDLLPARLKADDYPVSGFHEFRYSLSSDTPVRHYSQTRGCLAEHAPSRQVDKLQAFTITHITSDTPTLFHVFMSLSYDKPLYVLTVRNHLLWSVEHGNIRLLQDTQQPAKDK